MGAKKLLIILIILISVGVFASTILDAVYYSAADEVSLPDDMVTQKGTVVSLAGGSVPPQTAGRETGTPPTTKIIAAPISYIGELSIPKIKVSAKIEEVGISKKGNMAVPVSFSNVGWYKYGTALGGQGSAIIAGHIDNGIALPAVFSRLDQLEKGDDVYVETESGKLHYVVTRKDIYDFNADTSEVFADDSGKLLKLITCTGSWLSDLRTRNQRLVVIAELKE